MSTVDIFCALLNGAAVCLFDPRAEGIVRLASWMVEEEITIYNWTSTAFRVFAEALDQKDTFPKLRLIVLGGEPVTHKDVQRYKNCLSDDCILVNRLGSTETGNFRLFFVNKETEIKTGIVPAGYGVDGKEVLLLDDRGNELGFNEVGEIAIRSRYLCSGYWRQPELTEEVFLRDPAGSDRRLYMTGDLGLMRPDGCLEYIGRKDSRCKIRGRWVDIMEVETLLTQDQAVRAAVVVAHEYDAGDQRLVAYIVPAEQYRSPGELRRALRLKMPEYMIPSMFISLDALPLNPNGKLDRRALPPPLWSRAEQDGCVVAPRTPLEEKLAEIWAEVLGLEQVGIYDDFFELGGHSLHAAQVAGRIYNSFQVELPMRSFFEAATIAGLAEIVTEALAQKLKADQLSQVLASIERLSEAQVKKIVSESKMAENNREEQHPRTVVAVIKPDNLRNNDNR
jgi:acyl carrier protein